MKKIHDKNKKVLSSRDEDLLRIHTAFASMMEEDMDNDLVSLYVSEDLNTIIFLDDVKLSLPIENGYSLFLGTDGVDKSKQQENNIKKYTIPYTKQITNDYIENYIERIQYNLGYLK